MEKLVPKIAFVFPGVGSQHPEMLKSLYDQYPVARETFEEADRVLAMDLTEICFSKERVQELNQNEIAQVALVTASMAAFRVFEQELGWQPDYCLGHSLGEYSALCASGAISFADTLRVVYQRGQMIKKATLTGDGTMMWVINLDTQVVEEVLARHSAAGRELYISAYDTPIQCSISGKEAAIREAAQELEELGAIVYPLRMSGPFHSPLMVKAAEEMRNYLAEVQFHPLKYPVIANRTGLPYTAGGSLVDHLAEQLVSPIRWQQSLEFLLEHQVQIALELGPKDVLQFLIKKNTAKIQAFSFNKAEQIAQIRKKFEIGEDDALALIGRCLKLAVSTKNYASTEVDYHQKVVQPYKKIEALYGELEEDGQVPTRTQIQEAIQMVEGVFLAKEVPQKIKERKLQQILNGKLLAI